MSARSLLGCLVLLSCLWPLPARASNGATVEAERPKPWYESFRIRGYAQLRYNRLGATNPNLISDQGDKSIGDKNGLFLRRGRMIFSGDVGRHLSFYIQPDFASSPAAGVLNFAQLRDFYADIFLDEKKELRIRAGQSKIPYGFVNLQSSQNRLPLDRPDGTNSALKDERDIGVLFYWAPDEIRERFRILVESGLKGSGDYGVLGIGVFNGQTANRSEANNHLHYVARLTYPYKFEGAGILDGQILEPGLQAYSGNFTVVKGTGVGGPTEILDQRFAATLVLYPQPIGVELEYTVGRGPQLNAAQTAVGEESLHGGHALLSYKLGSVIPFARWHYYLGGRKHETNSPAQSIYETEIGVEWQFNKAVELTAMYSWADRTSAKAPFRNEVGRMVRLQLQWSY